MSAIIAKRLQSGTVYLQRFSADSPVDYWTPNPVEAHVFPSPAVADDWVRKLNIGEPVTVMGV